MVGEGGKVMPKVDACRNGCGTQIFVKQDADGKWKPFDARTNELHDCPNSEYNKKKQQGDSYRTPKPSSMSDFESRVLDKLDMVEKKLDAIYSGRAFRNEDELEGTDET
jgi:hypothetical protein